MLKNRPAETGGIVAMAGAILIARALGVDDVDVVSSLAIVLAFVPAGITFIVQTIRGRAA